MSDSERKYQIPGQRERVDRETYNRHMASTPAHSLQGRKFVIIRNGRETWVDRLTWSKYEEFDRGIRSQIAQGDDLSALYGDETLQREASIHDPASLALPAGSMQMPLGNGLAWDLAYLQGHGISFGNTRSGKGVQSLIPALLTCSCNMVVIDPKGENAWVTAERRRQMGHRVVILDPWGEVTKRYGSKATPPVEEQTTRFNPLSALDPDSEDFADDVAALADALVITSGGLESHWTDSARELIAGLVAALSSSNLARRIWEAFAVPSCRATRNYQIW